MNFSKVPIFQSLKFVKNSSLFIEENFENYGDFYKLNLPTQNIYVVANPEILQHVLIRNEQNYVKSKIYWGQLKSIVGNALGTIEGDEWVWLKKLQLKAFSHDKLDTYLSQLLSIYNKHFDSMESISTSINPIQYFSSLNISYLLKILFGVEKDQLIDQIANYIADGEEIIAYRSKFPWRTLLSNFNGRSRKYKNYLHFFNQFTEKLIQEVKPNVELGRLIDLLLLESNLFKENGTLDKQNIRNEIIIHLGAGTETAAVALGWTLYLLHLYPNILDKVRNEISNVVGTNEIVPENYKLLTYTDQVIKESLRLFPPSHAIIRDAVQEDYINGIKINKGDTFFISAYGLHRNPKFWEDPNLFKPERFLNEIQKYSYIPFGAGRHTCIGRYLAQPMLVLGLASFLKRYNYSFLNHSNIKPISLSTLKPNHSFEVKINKISYENSTS